MRFLLLLALFAVVGLDTASAEVWSSIHRLASSIEGQRQAEARKSWLIDADRTDELSMEGASNGWLKPSRHSGVAVDQLVEPATPEDVELFARSGIPLIEGVPPFAVLFPPKAGNRTNPAFDEQGTAISSGETLDR